MESVYIHIPFCKKICTYCDFTKVLKNDCFVDSYLESLEEEIKDKYNDEIMKTIYIGGGTPSCLDEKQLNKLFEIIKIFKTEEKIEFTFECNLDDINEDLVNILVFNKVNRVSIGIESFNEKKLKFMGRNHSFEDAKKSVNLLRNKGINNINIDLIYGINDETLKDLKKDLKLILSLNPEHISTYSLIHEDNTVIKINEEPQVEEDLDFKMYELIINKLSKKGYSHYEVSNFSKKGYESIHNLCYWNNAEYYGFGLGAHGYIHGVRYENTGSLTKYNQKKFLKEEKLLSKSEMMENELMLGLRKIKGINLQEFFDKYEINIQDAFPVKTLIKSKHLIYKDGYISISKDKIYIMNEILLKLI